MENLLEKECNFCKKEIGKYSCPRCNRLYCSLSCYQSKEHLECSETFYKNCVVDSVSAESKDQDVAKQKMLDILNKMKESNESEDLDSDDDPECSDLAERLNGVDLDDADKVWEKLTSDERQDFEAFLRSGDITEFVPKWEPWWSKRFDRKIQDVEVFENHQKECPKVKEDIKSLTNITTREPNPVVEYNLINIIAAYAFTSRYFNGCHLEFPDESVQSIMFLSLCLKENVNFDSEDLAVESVHHNCIGSEWITCDAENIKLMREDTKMIVNGPHDCDKKFYLLCALSDLHSVFTSQLSIKKKTNTKEQLYVPVKYAVKKSAVKVAIKKIEYFLSFVETFK